MLYLLRSEAEGEWLLSENSHEDVVLRLVEMQPVGQDAEVQTGGAGTGEEESASDMRTGSREDEGTTTGRWPEAAKEACAGPSGVDPTTAPPWSSSTALTGSDGAAVGGGSGKGKAARLSRKRAREVEVTDDEEGEEDDSGRASPPPPAKQKKKKKSRGQSASAGGGSAAASVAAAYVPGPQTYLARAAEDDVKDMLTKLIADNWDNDTTRNGQWAAVGASLKHARYVGPEGLKKGKLSVGMILSLLQDKEVLKRFKGKFHVSRQRGRKVFLAWVKRMRKERGAGVEEPQAAVTELEPARKEALKRKEAPPSLREVLDDKAALKLWRFLILNTTWDWKATQGKLHMLGKALRAFKGMATEVTHKWGRLSKQDFLNLATSPRILEAAVAHFAKDSEVKRMMVTLLEWAGVPSTQAIDAMKTHKGRRISYLEDRLDKPTHKGLLDFLRAKYTEASVWVYYTIAACGLKAALAADGRPDATGITKQSLQELLVNTCPCDAAEAATDAVFKSCGKNYCCWRTGMLAWLTGREAKEEEEEEEVGAADDEGMGTAQEMAADVEDKTSTALLSRVKPNDWPAGIPHDHVADQPWLDGRRVHMSRLDLTPRADVAEKRLTVEALDFSMRHYERASALYEGRTDTGWYHWFKQHEDVPQEGSPLQEQLRQMLRHLERTLLSRGVVPSDVTVRDCSIAVDWQSEVGDTHDDMGRDGEEEVEERLVKATCHLGMAKELVVRPTQESARPDGKIDLRLATASSKEVLVTLRTQVKAASRHDARRLKVPFGQSGRGRARACYEGYIIFIVYNHEIAATTNHGLLTAAEMELDGEPIEEPLVITMEAFKSWVCESDQELVLQIQAIAQSLHTAQETTFTLGKHEYAMDQISNYRGALIELSPSQTKEQISRRVLVSQLAASHGGGGPSVSLELFGTGQNDRGVVDYAFVCRDKDEPVEQYVPETGKMTYAPDADKVDNVQAKSIWPRPMNDRIVAHTFPLWHLVHNSVQPYHEHEPIDVFVGTVSSPEGQIAGSYFIPTSMMKMLGITGGAIGISCHPPLPHVVNRTSNGFAYKHTPWMSLFRFSAKELSDGTFASIYTDEIRKIFVTPYK